MRKKRIFKKFYKPDVKYDNMALGRFINYLMKKGKKSVAEKVIYQCFNNIEKTNKEPLAVFEKAIENASPVLEVISKRVGGANYQVPREVRPERRFFLSSHWIINAARAKKGKPMAEKLAEELMAAAKNEGAAIKKKIDTHRMAEANRAFAHFAR
ncbi:MAG: 30S ribosomal protein S7 [Patescibacteria group bacterium]